MIFEKCCLHFGHCTRKVRTFSQKLLPQPILNIFSVPWWKLLGTCTTLKHSFPKNIIIISIGVKFDDPCKAAAAAAKLIKKGAPMGEEVWSWQLTTLSSNLTDMWNYDYPWAFKKPFLVARDKTTQPSTKKLGNLYAGPRVCKRKTINIIISSILRWSL